MANQPPSPAELPPPNLPDMSGMPDALANYLRTFSLWCRNGFRAKLDVSAALPGVLLQAYDATPGSAPKVFMIRVNTAGAISATPMTLGSGQP